MSLLSLKSLFPFFSLLLISTVTNAANSIDGSIEKTTKLNSYSIASSDDFYHAPWGVAIGIRRADVPFIGDNKQVYDVIPLLQYQNKYLFLNGLEAGFHLWKQDNHQINLYSRFRFEDLPKALQNQTQKDGFDFGLQYRFTQGPWQTQWAIMSTGQQRYYSFAQATYQWYQGDWKIEPYAKLDWKSRRFNEEYYGLNSYSVAAGTSISAGVSAKYHVFSNLYLLGQFGINRLDDNIAALPIIDTQYQYETFLGFGFFPNDKRATTASVRKLSQDNGQFFRISHGWATPSNLGDILAFSTRSDPYNNQLTSFSYGTRLSKHLFGAPIELYFTPGLAWHQRSSVQNNSYEAFGAIKAFYTFELGPKWRFGVGEGLSYVTKLTYIEQTEMDEKGYQGSHLLNYLDFSLGVNLGDVFQRTDLNNLWLGYGIHHRSGIFEASSAFGRIKGGSNYQTVYLQWHF